MHQSPINFESLRSSGTKKLTLFIGFGFDSVRPSSVHWAKNFQFMNAVFINSTWAHLCQPTACRIDLMPTLLLLFEVWWLPGYRQQKTGDASMWWPSFNPPPRPLPPSLLRHLTGQLVHLKRIWIRIRVWIFVIGFRWSGFAMANLSIGWRQMPVLV